jgi:hypothetical protein
MRLNVNPTFGLVSSIAPFEWPLVRDHHIFFISK